MRKMSYKTMTVILTIFVAALFMGSIVLPCIGNEVARALGQHKSAVRTTASQDSMETGDVASGQAQDSYISKLLDKVEQNEQEQMLDEIDKLDLSDKVADAPFDTAGLPDDMAYELDSARAGVYGGKVASSEPTNLRVGRLMTRATPVMTATSSEASDRGSRASSVDILGASELITATGMTNQKCYSGITVVVSYTNAPSNAKLQVWLLQVGTNAIVGTKYVMVSGTGRQYVTVYNDYDFPLTQKGEVGANLNKGEYNVYAKTKLFTSSGTLLAQDTHSWSSRGWFGFSLIPEKAKKLWDDVKEKCKDFKLKFDLKEIFKLIFKLKKYSNDGELLRYAAWMFENANPGRDSGIKGFFERFLKPSDLKNEAKKPAQSKAEFSADISLSLDGVDLAFGIAGKPLSGSWYILPGLWGVIIPTVSVAVGWSVGLGFKARFNPNAGNQQKSLMAATVSGGGSLTIGIGASIAGVAEVGVKVKLDAQIKFGSETQGILFFANVGISVYGKILKFIDLSYKLAEWPLTPKEGMLICSYKAMGDASRSVWNWFTDTLSNAYTFWSGVVTSIKNWAATQVQTFNNELRNWINSYCSSYYGITLISRGDRQAIDLPDDSEVVDVEEDEYSPCVGAGASIDFYEIELSTQNHPNIDMPLLITLSYDHDAPPPDVRMYIKKGDVPSYVDYDKASSCMATQALIVSSPENTRYVLMVATKTSDGSASQYNLTINSNYTMPTGEKLNLNEEASGTVDEKAEIAPPCAWYFVEVPKGQGVSIELDGPGTFDYPAEDSDIDLYVFRGARPNETCYEFRGFNASSDAIIVIKAEESFSFFSDKDPYYLGLMVDAYKGVTGYTIRVRTI